MFKQLLSLGRAYENYMTHRGRVEAHRILLRQDEKTLQDIGIIRSELAGGVKNWPWDGSAQQQQAKPVATAQAIRELNSYSDRELHDIGINRGMIADAVTHGRAGIDTALPTKGADTGPVTGNDRRAA